jgi:hypothetical protein
MFAIGLDVVEKTDSSDSQLYMNLYNARKHMREFLDDPEKWA